MKFIGAEMPRKISTEPTKQLLVELPASEYQALEEYCLKRQETKRQLIRSLLRRLGQRQTEE
jgi:hypothetical protein